MIANEGPIEFRLRLVVLCCSVLQSTALSHRSISVRKLAISENVSLNGHYAQQRNPDFIELNVTRLNQQNSFDSDSYKLLDVHKTSEIV